jgi:hypothetical protein
LLWVEEYLTAVSANPSNPDVQPGQAVRVESDPEVAAAEDQPSRARAAVEEEVVVRNLEVAGEAEAEFHLHAITQGIQKKKKNSFD